MQNLKYLFFAVIIISTFSCVEISNQHTALPPGLWRATLDLGNSGSLDIISTDNETDRVFTELSESELPFNFEVVYTDDTTFYIVLINGEERMIVEDISFGKHPKNIQDTLRIEFPIFDSYITALYEEDKIQGFWHVNYRENYKIPFSAVHGQSHRFTNLTKEPEMNLSGKWEATFEIGNPDEYKGIGEFVQEGNRLTGTFLTETGDYRFLEGTVQGNKAYLSCFDGSHAFLFAAKILEDGSLIGTFKSGTHYITSWEAKRNETFELANPDDLTYLKDQQRFNFEFEDVNGDLISLANSKYDNKVSIVFIFGTWCPNCRDASNFLNTYFEQNPDLEINKFGIAFERYQEKEKAIEAIKRYKIKMNSPLEIMYGGYYDKEESSNKLPMLNKIISYPTIIILDKNRNVRKIHTGFSGPATSKYLAFKENFDEVIKSLVNE